MTFKGLEHPPTVNYHTFSVINVQLFPLNVISPYYQLSMGLVEFHEALLIWPANRTKPGLFWYAGLSLFMRFEASHTIQFFKRLNFSQSSLSPLFQSCRRADEAQSPWGRPRYRGLTVTNILGPLCVPAANSSVYKYRGRIRRGCR